MKRKVYIELDGNSWKVRFFNRKKGQRHYAAQFFAPDHSRQFVENWVRGQPRLILSDEHEHGN